MTDGGRSSFGSALQKGLRLASTQPVTPSPGATLRPTSDIQFSPTAFVTELFPVSGSTSVIAHVQNGITGFKVAVNASTISSLPTALITALARSHKAFISSGSFSPDGLTASSSARPVAGSTRRAASESCSDGSIPNVGSGAPRCALISFSNSGRYEIKVPTTRGSY